MDKKIKAFVTVAIILLTIIPFNSKSQSIKDIMEAYDNYQYETALKFLKKLWKKDKNNTELNYMYGKSILRSNTDRREAKKYLEIVIGNDISYKDANLEMGKAYVYHKEFKKAKQILNFFLKNYNFSNNEDDEHAAEKKKEAELLLKHIQSAELLLTKPLNVSFVNLGPNVNTKRSEINPFITQNGQMLYYSSNKKYDSFLLEQINNIYFTKFSSEEFEWTKMKSINKDINTDEQEVIVGISADEKKIIINVNWMKDEGDIFITNRDKKKFQELSELESTVNSEYDEPSAFLTKNNDTLYFCSNRPEGYGGLDIYISVKLPDGSWGKPFNLGPSINTEFNESYPIINSAGNHLLFSSDRPESMGGYDIFSADKKDNKWFNIKNIGYPVNNFYDNFLITYSKSMRYGYTSQIRNDGYGEADIYQIIFNDIPPPHVIYTGTIKKRNGSNLELITEPIEIEAIDLTNNKLFTKSTYSKKGKYTFAFPPGKYKIKITGPDFKDYERAIRIPDAEPRKSLIIKNITIQQKIK